MAERNILDLPYEVLDLIYKNLTTWRDQTNLAQADEYLGEAYAYHSRNRLKTVAPWDSISWDMWATSLSLCGTTVREFKCHNGHKWSDTFAKLVEQHCPNLEKVHFDVTSLNCNSIRSVIANASATMKEIKLDVDTRVTARLPPMMLHEYPDLPQLRKGSFVRFSTEEFFHIQKFNSLEELIMEGGTHKRKPIKVFEIAANLKKLRSLTLLDCNIVESGDGYGDGDAPPMPFPSLESLQIKYAEISTELPLCPKLISLHIHSCTSSIKYVFYRFILKQGTLENLKVDCRPSFCDGDGFLEILRRCQRLRLFCLQAQKVKFTRTFVETMMDILKDNGVTPDEPFHLRIDGRAKASWTAKWLRLTSHSNLLDVDHWHQ